MKRSKCLFLAGLLVLSVVSPTTRAAETAKWNSHVFQLVAQRPDGTRETGSAVALAGDRLVTNCHVIAGANRLQVENGAVSLPARAAEGDNYRDLCFIHVPGLDVPPIPMIGVGETRVGLDVVSAGYPGGRFALSGGRIIGLHTCECDGGKVIQTSAPFDRGASGGGLFDAHGRLIGILTFKSRNGGNFHFALPVGWLRHIAQTPAEPVAGNPGFWTDSGKKSAYFLAACSLGEQKDWRALAQLAEEWCEREPYNPEAWMAMGRAHRGLSETPKAMQDFKRVLMLDSTHTEAQWALQELEMITGHTAEQGSF